MQQRIDEWMGRIASLPRRRLLMLGAAGIALIAGAAVLSLSPHPRPGLHEFDAEISSQTRRATNRYRPTDAEWSNLTVEKVEQRSFVSERATEGKIALNDEHATPIFSPYSGRVMKLLVKAGDKVERGQPLFVISATDTVQSLNDLMAAVSAKNKAQAQLALLETVVKRDRALYEARAVPLRDLQKAENDLTATRNDDRAADAALEAARNRVRLLGHTDAEIDAFQQTGKIDAATAVTAPLAGTVVARKVGPGQFLNAGASDPVFVIGDLSTVWLSAYVREADAQNVHVGQPLSFTVTALPGRTFQARIDYVAAALDPATRRLQVRATVDNSDGMLKPEMFAAVEIFTRPENLVVAVPGSALIRDGGSVSVWLVRDDRTIELRRIKTGAVNGKLVQVTEGLSPGDRIVTGGSLFLDRAAS